MTVAKTDHSGTDPPRKKAAVITTTIEGGTAIAVTTTAIRNDDGRDAELVAQSDAINRTRIAVTAESECCEAESKDETPNQTQLARRVVFEQDRDQHEPEGTRAGDRDEHVGARHEENRHVGVAVHAERVRG